MERLSQFAFGDSVVLYLRQEDTIGMMLLPQEHADQFIEDGTAKLEPLIQLKILGDGFADGYSGGLTMRDSASTKELKYTKQVVERDTINTYFTNQYGHTVIHKLTLRGRENVCETSAVFRNTSSQTAVLEMLSSFALGISPAYAQTDAIRFHRLQSYWSAEGRLHTDTMYDMHLERSWADFAVRNERYGSIGSMPVRKWFPFGAVENTTANILWGVQLYHPGSWQMEFSVKDDSLAFSGGLADHDFGHWTKQVLPGDEFSTPAAVLSVCTGSVDALCNRLVAAQRPAFLQSPETEHTLPVLFNEYCTTWGNPTYDSIVKMTDEVASHGFKYFVIDAGWYSHDNWSTCMGDWLPDTTVFPTGLKAAADYIRSKGLIPGLWFELECVGPKAEAVAQTEHMLHRDGALITVGIRKFWNMRDPWVQELLYQRVIRLLKECGFGYIKIDYNDTIPVGCDGDDSIGENLRRHLVEGTQAFFRRLREEIPDLVIEGCASGGQRLEPSMMALCSMASFSDAHECDHIPIIAANLHRAILPAQSQIWSVIRADHSDDKIKWQMINGFLGRLCLSGEIYDLSSHQWKLIDQAIEFYRRIAPLILWGETKRYGTEFQSYLKPSGWQGVLRTHGDLSVYIVHSFGGVESAVMPSGWRIIDTYGSDLITVQGSSIELPANGMYAKSFLLEKMSPAP